MPLSGPAGSYGMGEEAAVELAVASVNAHGGVLGGRKLMLTSADTMGTSTGSVAAWQRLVAQSPVAVLGPILTAEVAPLVGPANTAGIPLLEGSSTQALEAGAGEMGSQWFFRMTETSANEVAAEVQYMMSNLHPSRPAILSSNDELGQAYTAAVDQNLQKNSLSPVATEYADDTATDFTAQISAILAAHPDVVFFDNLVGQTATFLKQAKQQGLTVPFYSGSSMLGATYYFNLAPISDIPPNSVLGDADFPQGDTIDKGAAAFVAAYKAKTGQTVNDVSTMWYTAVFALAAAIDRAGSTDPTKLAAALRATKNFNSWNGISMPSPPETCDANQNCATTTLLTGVTNGSLTSLGIVNAS